MSAPTPDQLKALLSYDADTGEFVWAARPVEMFKTLGSAKAWNVKYAGKPAFTATAITGYKVSNVLSTVQTAHRVAWAISHGEWPVGEVDHINGVRGDNRLSNLRVVTRKENQRNRAKGTNNTSGHFGVFWVTQKRKWRAEVGGKHIGYFCEKAAAVEAAAIARTAMGYHVNHGR